MAGSGPRSIPFCVLPCSIRAPAPLAWFGASPASRSIRGSVKRRDNTARQPAKRVPGMPVAIGDLIWAGQLFADARTADLVEPPFPATGDEAYTLLTRGAWCRTPTAALDRHGSALVQQRRRIGWLEVKSGRFELVGELPDDAPTAAGLAVARRPRSARRESQADKLIRVDLRIKKTTRIQLHGPYPHPQAIFDWTIGPDDNFYGSCYSHEMWAVDQTGKYTNHGDVVQVHGGELHGFPRGRTRCSSPATRIRC